MCAGTYKGSSDENCLECAEGKFSPIVGANTWRTCQDCPQDSDSVSGSTSVNSCSCNAGFTKPTTSDSCAPCGAGQYKAWTGDGACNACEAGKFSEQGASACIKCQSNEYSLQGSSACQSCPANSKSAASNSICICNAGYQASGASCSGCEIGKYKAEAGNELCTSCPTSGRATTLSAGSTSVTDCRCLPGSTGADGQDCILCEAGKYKSTVGAEECVLCAAGTYSGITGQTSSDSCNECDFNTFSAADATSCVPCPEHSSAVAGSSSSNHCKCNAGYQASGASCSGCEIGKYKAEAGNELCTSCPTSGRATTLSAGSTSVTDCRCLPGSTGADGQDCILCEAGKYKSTVGAEECVLCAAGTYSGITGQTSSDSCNECDFNTYSALEGATSSNSCVVCPDDRLSARGSSSLDDCKASCPAGTQTGEPGSCTSCAPNTYNDEENGQCLDCPVHSQSSEGSASCLCHAGYELRNEECKACPAGKHKPTAGNGPCEECDAGTYSGAEAAISSSDCLACPEHSSSPAGSTDISQCACLPGMPMLIPMIRSSFTRVRSASLLVPLPSGNSARINSVLSWHSCTQKQEECHSDANDFEHEQGTRAQQSGALHVHQANTSLAVGKEIASSARAASILTSVRPHQRPAAGSVQQTDTRQRIKHSAFAAPITRALNNGVIVLMTASATLGTSV